MKDILRKFCDAKCHRTTWGKILIIDFISNFINAITCINFCISDVANATLHFSVCKIYCSQMGQDVRLKFFHHTHSISRCINTIYHFNYLHLRGGAKLHNTVSRNDRSRYTRIDPFRERFSTTGTTFFSLAAYYKCNHIVPSFVSLAKREGNKRRKEKTVGNLISLGDQSRE